MTVPSSSNRMEYTGNGIASEFDYTFKIFADTDLQVYVVDTAGVETQLVLATDFTVAGAGDPDGGSITLTAGALAVDYELVILREVPLTQEVDLRNQGAYYPETVETMGDRLMMGIQQLAEKVTRTLQFRPSDDRTTAPKTNQLPVPQTGYALSWDADGNLENVQLAAINYDILITGGDAGKVIKVNATEDGIDVGVSYTDANTASTIIQRDAAGRAKVSDPSDTQDIATKNYVDTQFSAGSVTTAKLADGAVTVAKIDPTIWLTQAGTYGVSVVTTPSAANEYATIQAAFAAVLSANIPAGGYVEIDVTKTALTNDDKIAVPEGADYRWIRLRFRGSTYSIPGGSGDSFIAVGMAARGPRIWLTGSATFSVGSGTDGISVMEGGELFISGSSTSYTLTINSPNGPMSIRGGRVFVRDIDLALTGDFAALRIRQGGEVVTDSDTATISATCSTANEAAIVLETGSRLSCKGVTATSGHANAVAVSSGSDAILQGLTATSTGTRVLATAAGMINLNGSTETCNLTNNTVSTNGILIR